MFFEYYLEPGLAHVAYYDANLFELVLQNIVFESTVFERRRWNICFADVYVSPKIKWLRNKDFKQYVVGVNNHAIRADLRRLQPNINVWSRSNREAFELLNDDFALQTVRGGDA